MKFRIHLVVLLLAAMLLPQASIADTAVQRALAFAEQLQGQAAGSVAVAQKRVAAAEASLRLAQSADAYAKSTHDREAMPVAAEAVLEAGQGLREARQLLERAEALEKKRSHTVDQLRRASASALSSYAYALVVPIEGDVRRFNAQGEPYTRRGMEQGVHVTYNYGSGIHFPLVPNLDGGLNPGDRIETGPSGKARLFVAGGDGEVELGKNSSFTVEYEGIEGFVGHLERGVTYLNCLKPRLASKFEVRTFNGAGAVRGTVFAIEVISEGTQVKVFEGIVSFTPTSGGDPVDVLAGTQRRFITGLGFLPAEPLAEADKLHPWSSDAPAR